MCGGVININESQNILDSTTLESKSQSFIKLVRQASHPVHFDIVGGMVTYLTEIIIKVRSTAV